MSKFESFEKELDEFSESIPFLESPEEGWS